MKSRFSHFGCSLGDFRENFLKSRFLHFSGVN
ncbi:hypothetical protein T11_5284 [Trichinella zimbabwensis]|uniref:Uncharacterized protein n=1 Tax=Trichinella zimbabwensis TaxID=268475 RepID=A0A0V1GDX0_9BILA|nr:hypothetical protein T11_5284 [Trichinella zimbabwensis]